MSPSPLFLCGVARSGTTYLLTLLNAAAPIHLTYESRLIREGIGLAQQLPPHPDTTRFARFIDELIAGESENIRNVEPGLEQETQAILSAHPPQTASLHKWRQQLTAADTRQIEAYCFAGMQALGYQPELATEARPLRRASYLWHLGQTFKGVLTRPRLILRKRLWERLRIMLHTQNDNK